MVEEVLEGVWEVVLEEVLEVVLEGVVVMVVGLAEAMVGVAVEVVLEGLLTTERMNSRMEITMLFKKERLMKMLPMIKFRILMTMTSILPPGHLMRLSMFQQNQKGRNFL